MFSNPKSTRLSQFLLRLMSLRRSNFTVSMRNFFLFKVITPIDFIISIMLGALSGIAIIVAINIGSSLNNNLNASLGTASIFLIFLYIYKTTQTSLLETCVIAVEAHLEEIRSYLSRTIVDLEYYCIEYLPKNGLLTGLTKHYDIVNNGVIPLTSAIRSIPLIIMLFLYLWYISWISALILVFMCFVCGNVYLSKLTILRSSLHELYASENTLIGLIDELFSGFLELKYSDLKKNELANNLCMAIENSASSRLTSSNVAIELITFTSMINYLFAGCIVFLLPLLSGHDFSDISKIVALSLFLIGPIGSLIEGIQQYELVRFSYMSIVEFKDKIESLNAKYMLKKQSINITNFGDLENFHSIICHDIVFSRKNIDATPYFTVGPSNISLTPGKLVILEGGNGSGKTTFIRMITGLYLPESGSIACNGILVTSDNVSNYREHFGIITSDYHVFKKLYGISEEKVSLLNNYLIDLGITKCCVKDVEQELIVDELSTGQRKRLALAITLTENKPVLVFDEWAADQDPYFRNKFYKEILPSLKSKGKAIIVVSHDDRYFDIADERYHMEDGKLKRVYSKRNSQKK